MRAHTIAMRYRDPFDWGVNLGITWLAEASRADASAYCLQMYADGDHAVCAVGYQLHAATDMPVLHARLAILCYLFESAQLGARVPPRVELFVTSGRSVINSAIHATCGIKYAVTDALALSCADPWPHVSFGRVLARKPPRLGPVPRPTVIWVGSNMSGKSEIPTWLRKPWG